MRVSRCEGPGIREQRRERRSTVPRQNIAAENVRSSSGDRFARLKLETNEVAIFCLFQPPWMEWVHTLRAIKIEGGVAQKEPKVRRDKSTYEDWKYEFIGRPICLGDSSILADQGIDKQNSATRPTSSSTR